MKEEDTKQDYSNICDGDDDNENNPCWSCTKFCFPIGCMVDVETKEK